MKTVMRFNEWWSYRSLGEKTMFVLIAIVGVLSACQCYMHTRCIVDYLM